MEEIITNEWIAYKSGFIDAKNELAEKLAFNLPDPFAKEKLEVESWYKYGYDDCYNYFKNKNTFVPLTLDILRKKEEIKKIMKTCFTEKVVLINQLEEKQIPVAKFKINKK